VVVFAGLVLWAGEVAHAVESTAQFSGAIAADGLAPSEDDCAARHLDEGGAGRRGDVDACGVVPTPIGEPTAGAGDVRPVSESEAQAALHPTMPGVRGPPGPT
jgi:hypothetical protein